MRWLWFLLFALPAVAQTTTISGKLQTYNPAIAPNALGNYVEFALTNCGNNTPQVSGVAVLLQKAVDFYPDATGALTAAANGGNSPTLYGNDVISCGGAFTSRYSVRYFVGGIPQGPAKFYYVSSTASFNLTTAVPINLQPPLNPPYPNLTKCEPGQYTIGLNKDLSVQCVNLPSGASNAIVSDPTGSQYIAQPAGTTLRSNELFGIQIVDGLTNTTIQQAVNAAGQTGMVIIPSDYQGTDGDSNPNNVSVWDLRAGGAFYMRQSPTISANSFIQFAGTNLHSTLLKTDLNGKIIPAVVGTDYSSPGTGVSSFNTRTGAVTLNSGDVTGALGYTPPTPGGTGAAGTWGINVTGNSATSSLSDHSPTLCAAGQYARGVTNTWAATGCTALPTSSSVVQSVKKVGNCTTGSGSYSACTDNLNWPTPFADTNYTVTCQGINGSDPRAYWQVAGYNTVGVIVSTITGGSTSVSFGEIDCQGVHQ